MNREEQDRMTRAIEEMERELAEPLRHFRGAVTAMAQRELRRMPGMAMRSEKRTGWRSAWLYAWAPAAALLVLMAVGLVMSSHDGSRTAGSGGASVAKVEPAPAPAPQAQAHTSAAALMTEIDDDLNQNAPTPLMPLEVSTTSQSQTNTTQAEGSNGVEP